MSIIKFGVLVVGARGTFGGATFSANHAGPYVKSWARPSNPTTDLQTAQRARLASIPALWRPISTFQKGTWDDWAALPAQDLVNALGETYHLTGFQWFSKINIRLLVLGRATRVAIPTQSRPSAPTIADMELPYDLGQTAFVEYAPGAFDPDFDLVLELSQASSIGRTVPSGTFLEIAVAQDPNDTMIGFAEAYNRRFGLGNIGLKGFARLYRQTTDGLRSAPGASDFISTQGTNYAPTALDYDASTQWSTHTGALTGGADGKTMTIVAWLKVNGGDDAARTLFSNTANRFQLMLTNANKVRFNGVDTTGSTVVQVTSTQTILAASGWHIVALSIDTASSRALLSVDGAAIELDIGTMVADGIMDFVQATHFFAARPGFSQLWNGCISSFWLTLNAALDVTDPAVLSAFISRDNGPQFLGDAGQLPTGESPVIYFPDGDAENNAGTGEDFTNAGAPGGCADAP